MMSGNQGSRVIKARGFDEVDATVAASSKGVAKFYDSIGNDAFVADPAQASMTGPGTPPAFHNVAANFAQTQAWSTMGGFDTAQLNGSTGKDLFVASPAYAYLSGSTGGKSYYYRANAFESVVGDGKGGTTDMATLTGSEETANPGVDTFVAGVLADNATTRGLMSDGTYSGSDINGNFTPGSYSYLLEAKNFRTLSGESKSSNDVARLFDSALSDTFTAAPAADTRASATLNSGSVYNLTATKFSSIEAKSSGQLNDRALLKDSTQQADDLVIGSNQVGLYNAALNYALLATDFHEAHAQLADPMNTTQPKNNRFGNKADYAGALFLDPSDSWWVGP
jgi:hypothetical protein